MKIGIDGTSLCLPHHCGVKHYSENLLQEIVKIDKKNEYFVFLPKHYDKIRAKNLHFILLPHYLPFFKRQLFLSLLVKKYKIDVFHYLEPFGSVFLKHPRIVTTIHDINLAITYSVPNKILFFLKRYYCEITRYFVVKNTSNFIFATNAVYKEFLDYFNKKPYKINKTIIYEGVSRYFFTNKQRPTSNGGNFLCMSDFSPRKNIINTFKAYKLLSNEVRSRYPLILVTSSRKYMTDVKVIAKRIGILKNLIPVVEISNKSLATTYKKSTLFLYPSLYEGFGLPIIEAMASGCPVITSNYGATSEIGANVALLVNPRSPNSIAQAMNTIVTNPRLAKILSTKGVKHARRFTWEKTAQKTLAVYKSMLSQQ